VQRPTVNGRSCCGEKAPGGLLSPPRQPSRRRRDRVKEEKPLESPLSRSTAATLPAEEAHVWLTAAGGRAARRPDWLDSDERARWLRFVRAADRDLFLVAHTHLRATLSRYTGTTADALRFVKRPDGRPELAAASSLRFNLSHTAGLAACVVTSGASCGIDVEREGRVEDWAAVGSILLHPDERAALAGSPAGAIAYWTLKESYLKATGSGLRVRLSELRFELGAEPTLRFANGCDTPTGWRFAHLRPTDDHHLAVSLRPARAVRVFWS
jgi:4'-phosphopantetheinyl transferase